MFLYDIETINYSTSKIVQMFFVIRLRKYSQLYLFPVNNLIANLINPSNNEGILYKVSKLMYIKPGYYTFNLEFSSHNKSFQTEVDAFVYKEKYPQKQQTKKQLQSEYTTRIKKF